MNKVLKDPIAPTERTDGRFEWSFKAPCYDNRTSSSIPGGNYYGIGFRTPVGKEKPRSMTAGPIPQESRAYSPNEIFYGKNAEDQKG